MSLPRRRSGCASQSLGLLLASFRDIRCQTRAARPARPAASCIRSLGFSAVFVAAFLGRRSDFFFADLKAFLVSAANQVAPHHVGPDARLERLGTNALGLQRLRQLVRSDAHSSAHGGIGLIDVAGGRIDAEFLSFPDFHLFVDQLVDHLLTIRHFMGAQHGQLGTLLDVEIRDGFAVDHDNDLLRPCRRWGCHHQNKGHAAAQDECRKPSEECNGHGHLRYVSPSR